MNRFEIVFNYGLIAYGLAGHMMEENFIPASKILSNIFNGIKS